VTPEQLRRRNRAISAGQERAWRDPEIRARRSAAIAKAQHDPLHRALMRRQWETRQARLAEKCGEATS
jgi:hypothetical protein